MRRFLTGSIALDERLCASKAISMKFLLWCRAGSKEVFSLGASINKKFIIITVLSLIPPLAHPHESVSSDQVGVIHILKSYSQRTGVKFVTDPRIVDRMKANMFGLDVNELTKANLVEMLISLDCIPFEKDGVVFVQLRHVVETSEADYGELWGSN